MKRNTLNIIFLLIGLAAQPVHAQFVVCQGSGITISDGASLHIGSDLYIKSDATGTGHLADQNTSGNISLTGDVTIERFLSQDGWHNISAPLNNITSSSITGTDLIFYYDETIILNDWNFGWVWYSGPFSVMQGYDIFLNSSITAVYYTGSIAGLNTGTYSFGVTRTDVPNGEVENRKGWNLLGNPYSSPVDWLQESGWDKSDINDAKYIWNPDNNNYTIFLGGTSPTGINGGTQYIPSSQGFWVQAVQNGSVSISNSTRMGVATGTPSYYKESENELRIVVTGNGYSDETMIRTIPGSTFGFDQNNDASKLFSRNDSVPQIYTNISRNYLAINTIPEVDSIGINLQFRCKLSGYYQMQFSYNNEEKVFLYDNLNHTYYEIYNGMEIRFYHSEGNPDSRFRLYYKVDRNFMDNIRREPVTITTDGKSIFIIPNIVETGNGQLNIFSLSGKLFASYSVNLRNKTSIVPHLKKGWYIASIIINNQYYNYKIGIF